MRGAFRLGLALVGTTMLLAAGCADDKDAPATAAAGASSSSAPAPAATTTLGPFATTSLPATSLPATTVPVGPAVAEAGGWRLVITAPVSGATIGSAVDLCYVLTGPAPATVALDVALVLAQTGTTTSSQRVDAAVGSGSARVTIGNPEPRFYDMTVQGIVNGQPVDKLAVKFGVRVAAGQPAGCP